MAITVTTGTVAAASTGPVTVTLPSHTTGDLLVLFGFQRATATGLTVTTATGWTAIQTAANATYGSIGVWYKYAASGAETNPVLTGATNTNLSMIGVAMKLANAATTSPVDVSYTPSTFAAPTTPFDVTATAVTTTANDSEVFTFWASHDNNSWTLQTAGWTGHVNGTTGDTSLGTDAGIAIASKTQGTAGSAGTVTSRQTAVAGDEGTYVRFAIKVAPTIQVSGSESISVSMTDTANLAINNAVSVSDTATPTISTESASIAGSASRTETYTGSAVTDVASISGTLTASDSLTISVSDAASVSISKPASDSISVSITESSSIDVFSGIPYARVNNQWVQGVIKVRKAGAWVVAVVYVRNAGTWKRIQ